MGFEYCCYTEYCYTKMTPTPTRLTPLNVYGISECDLHPPKGYEFVAFRPPALDEIYMSHEMTAAIATRHFEDSEPQLIVRALPEPKKIVRVIRVLEYIGPEDWIIDTMEHNAVKSNHNQFTLASGRNIRELFRYQEEMK